jgi:hypothetical protein
LINRQTVILNAFATDALNLLGPQATMLQAFDRYGINLYIAGAAQEGLARSPDGGNAAKYFDRCSGRARPKR